MIEKLEPIRRKLRPVWTVEPRQDLMSLHVTEYRFNPIPLQFNGHPADVERCVEVYGLAVLTGTDEHGYLIASTDIIDPSSPDVLVVVGVGGFIVGTDSNRYLAASPRLASLDGTDRTNIDNAIRGWSQSCDDNHGRAGFGSLAHRMAQEIQAEIDAEIINTLLAVIKPR